MKKLVFVIIMCFSLVGDVFLQMKKKEKRQYFLKRF